MAIQVIDTLRLIVADLSSPIRLIVVDLPYCRLIVVDSSLPSPIRFSPVRRDVSDHNGLCLTVADLLLAGPSRRFSSQQFAPHCCLTVIDSSLPSLICFSSVRHDTSARNGSLLTVALPSSIHPYCRRFASRRSVATFQIATVRASPLPIRFSPVRRDTSDCYDSRLTVGNSLLASPSRRFSLQRFALHRRQFASRRSVATLQIATVRASPSPIRFSSVCRDASDCNGSLLFVADSLFASPS
nr:hypothetical protein CFP56_67516 [Quercus suber]